MPNFLRPLSQCLDRRGNFRVVVHHVLLWLRPSSWGLPIGYTFGALTSQLVSGVCEAARSPGYRCKGVLYCFATTLSCGGLLLEKFELPTLRFEDWQSGRCSTYRTDGRRDGRRPARPLTGIVLPGRPGLQFLPAGAP